MLSRLGSSIAATSGRTSRIIGASRRLAHKEIAYGAEARELISRGVEKLAKAVSVTLGPGGRCVLIEQPYSGPKITKDGVTVAKAITLENKFENIGARLVQDVANKTNEAAGDGTTTATVLAQAIYIEGIKALGYGCNPTDLRRGVQLAVASVVEFLKKNARKVVDSEQIVQIATISANGDAHIGKMIADAMAKVGNDGVITIKEGTTLHDKIEVTKGMRFDRGFISPFFITCPKTQKCDFEKPLILLSENKISSAQDLIPALEAAMQARRPLMIIAEDVDGEALALLILNKLRGTLAVVAVRAPGFGDNRREVLQDIAVLTGAQVFSNDQGTKLEKAVLSNLGECASVTVSKDNTTILSDSSISEALKTRCELIRATACETESTYDKERMLERLAKLTQGVAVLSVGGSSEVEVGERKDRYVDSLHATRAAVDEGVLPGGGIALLRSVKALEGDAVKTSNEDQRHGVNIVRRALTAPASTIVRNTGANGEFVIRMLTDSSVTDVSSSLAKKISSSSVISDMSSFSMGYDAVNEKYVDMFKAGIIDPLKVVRTALVDAAGVASLITTAECVIVDAPKKDEAPSMGGGGMGGMGGMGGGMGF